MLNINPGLLIYWNSFSPVISVLISEVSVLMYTGYILSTPILTSIGSTPYLSRHVNRFSALFFYKKKKGEKKGKKGTERSGPTSDSAQLLRRRIRCRLYQWGWP